VSDNHITTTGMLIEKADIIPMYIKNVIDTGVFAKVGTIETFIPIHLLRYGFVTNIHAEYEVGKQIFVKVINIERKNGKNSIEVSGIDAQIDPWSKLGIVSELTVGEMHSGIVTAIKDYGLFINLYDGVDALVRPMSKKAYNYEPVHVGDKVDIKITGIDYKKRQITGKLRMVEKRIRIHF